MKNSESSIQKDQQQERWLKKKKNETKCPSETRNSNEYQVKQNGPNEKNYGQTEIKWSK